MNTTQMKRADLVRQLVCEHYGVPVSQVIGKGREQKIVVPRQVTCYMLYKILGMTSPDTARWVQRSNHGTALHAISAVSDKMSVYPQFKTEIETLEKKCQALS